MARNTGSDSVCVHMLEYNENVDQENTLLGPYERTSSKAPNGRATDVGTPTQDGTLPFRYEILRDLAPTWYRKEVP